MRVLITGASGFIGRQLVARLLSADSPVAFSNAELVLLDLRVDLSGNDPRVSGVEGSVGDPEVLARAFVLPFDIIFHLVSIPGGAAEQNFDLGKQINLNATLLLLEEARAQSMAPVFVYSSSIGVYGEMGAEVTDATPAQPNWSYGTHKLIGELLVADYTRKGFIDGRTLRFPGIVARPLDPNGHQSAFLSNLLTQVSRGESFVCPVSADAFSWWMSVQCCVDNVLHAALLANTHLGAQRVWTLPPLRASIAEVVDALARVYDVPAKELVTYKPQADMEERFGKLPPAHFVAAEALGFRSDGTPDALVRRALIHA